MNEDTSGTGEAYDPFAQPYLPALPPAHDAPDSQAPPEAPASLEPTRGDSSSPPRASGVSGATMDHKGKRLYVGQLSFDTTDREIRDIFSKIGSLRYCRIMTDKGTNKSRGFAFVGFSTRAAAQKAMQMWDNRELNGRRLKIRLAEPRAGEGEGGADEGGGGREDRTGGGVRGANGGRNEEEWKQERWREGQVTREREREKERGREMGREGGEFYDRDYRERERLRERERDREADLRRDVRARYTREEEEYRRVVDRPTRPEVGASKERREWREGYPSRADAAYDDRLYYAAAHPGPGPLHRGEWEERGRGGRREGDGYEYPERRSRERRPYEEEYYHRLTSARTGRSRSPSVRREAYPLREPVYVGGYRRSSSPRVPAPAYRPFPPGVEVESTAFYSMREGRRGRSRSRSRSRSRAGPVYGGVRGVGMEEEGRREQRVPLPAYEAYEDTRRRGDGGGREREVVGVRGGNGVGLGREDLGYVRGAFSSSMAPRPSGPLPPLPARGEGKEWGRAEGRGPGSLRVGEGEYRDARLRR
ncbi:hypothetical protein NSK_001875 [Nannochloropsis salina CCMP1776]|uniref:RRM domain-containing protein n=1 Tax=Nannochloropsis salina CCMP1776 TaxID=1027361 RepID=A0A4D9D8T1_9STRA|nr:hypothetical protein NSK_001875 [Nannochloropsis salina CCMP1776]|eukprot:TFJ86787.1 hypothetical protein NSK_001875 [Nannochloropsis salina CCMP1776]